MTLPKLTPSALPDWPRYLRRRLAAAYLDMSEEFFAKNVPVRGIAMGGIVVWDRKALDAWADAQSAAAERSGEQWAELLDAGEAAAR